MPQLYVETHWNKFVESIDSQKSQGETGTSPMEWIKKNKLQNVVSDELKKKLQDVNKLDREKVRNICRDKETDVLVGYICAMAWGGQGMQHVKNVWKEKEEVSKRLELLRAGNLTRCKSYDLFIGKGKILGLGPAYWTKLLYFFSPTEDFYIMDQWTAKSVNLLKGLQVVKMEGNSVSSSNMCGNYQAFCEEIDSIAARLKETGGAEFSDVTGAKVEEWLFSRGSVSRKDGPWVWRAYVLLQCNYDPKYLLERYPEIKKELFCKK